MTTLETILKELHQQHDKSRSNGLGWLDADNPCEVDIDGRVDVVALAAAIDAETTDMTTYSTTVSGTQNLGPAILREYVAVVARIIQSERNLEELVPKREALVRIIKVYGWNVNTDCLTREQQRVQGTNGGPPIDPETAI